MKLCCNTNFNNNFMLNKKFAKQGINQKEMKSGLIKSQRQK